MATISTTPLLGDSVHGVLDYKGNPATRSKTGRWSSLILIIGVEMAESMAYYGISSNLITYLTGPMCQSTAAAARNLNIWSGVASMLPLFGAVVADSYLGRYRTILAGSLLHLLAMGMLTLSAVLPSLNPSSCSSNRETSNCSPPSQFQVLFLFFSLYLMALGQGAHKPCTQAFGADQFDEQDPEESESRSSFFNWWFFGLCGGSAVSMFVMSYVQDNVGWGLGFGIPCVCMGFALGIFVIGTRIYRYRLPSGENPIWGISRFFVACYRNWNWRTSASGAEEGTTVENQVTRYRGTEVPDDLDTSPPLMKDWCINIKNDIEDAEWVFRLFPIWATCLMYGVISAQVSTFFIKQGATLDRKIVSTFQIPPAALLTFITLTIIVLIPIYQWILVPMARIFTGISTGITILQRVGIGLFLSVILMATAALVEMKRLRVARDFGLVDFPIETIPMSIWWLVPQYLLFGAAEVFAFVGLQEFFYDQMPDGLRSLGIALCVSIYGVGNFLSGLLISLVETVSGGTWLCDNLNQAHLDYFYWLLNGLSIVELVAYLYFAKSYVYRRKI